MKSTRACLSVLVIFVFFEAGCGARDATQDEKTPAVAATRMAREATEPAAPGVADRSDSTGALPEHLLRQINLPDWFDRARSLNSGETIEVKSPTWEDVFTLQDLGFRRLAPELFEKRVDLLAKETLTYSTSAALPGVDAIAIVTIDREGRSEQYLYRTLRSLFAELPDEMAVNLMVGNANVDYVSFDRLVDHVGSQYAHRVHVVPATQVVADHLQDNPYCISAKATWNYARALRSYEGHSSLMLLEDDVEFATGAIANMRPWLARRPAKLLMLFNDRCHIGPSSWQLPESRMSVSYLPVARNSDFPTTQGALYAKEIAQAAGNFIAMRAARESYDYMLGRFFAEATGGLGFFYPSPLQHIGRTTTGLSGPGAFPQSQCYQPDLTVPPT